MTLFVPVREPSDIRRDLLVSSKTMVGALRRYEHYRELRKAKLESFQELALIWADIARLQRKLKLALPKTDIKPGAIRPIPAQVQKPMAPKAAAHDHKSKMQMLEEQLAKIEGKLQQLQ